MRLELHYRSDVDLSRPGMQVEIRNHIARCLRDYPGGDEGVITLAGVEHRFMYVVHDDVVDTVIGPPDYIEHVANERRQTAHEARSPLPRKEHNQLVLGASPVSETRQNELAQEPAAVAPRGIGAGAGGLKGRCIYRYRLRLRWITSIFIRLGCICDAALLDVLGESSRAKPRQPRRTLGSATRRFGFWGRATEGAD
ncbi:MAG TPA: hypothetical protein VM910_24550 [Bradyrhizobium sp.]|jgi:hypothetical protein|nr:hypothetical protein [Bradyrhizobium sp.]